MNKPLVSETVRQRGGADTSGVQLALAELECVRAVAFVANVVNVIVVGFRMRCSRPFVLKPRAENAPAQSRERARFLRSWNLIAIAAA